MATENHKHHFLLVCSALQSHINPTLRLAHQLARAGARVSFSTTVSGHHRMFLGDGLMMDSINDPEEPLLCYVPHSDGFDDGYDYAKVSFGDYMSRLKEVGSKTLYTIASAMPTATRPAITHIIYSILQWWAADVASSLGLPSTLLWIQPANVFTLYHHYFHAHKAIITTTPSSSSLLHLPNLPPLLASDLPSFINPFLPSDSDTVFHLLASFQNMFDVLDKEVEKSTRPIVLVNTFEELEREALEGVEGVEMVSVGPLVGQGCGDLVKKEEHKEACMQWLERWGEKEVVYVSFGSISVMGKRQNEELARALERCGRPYLWVAKEADREGVVVEADGKSLGEMGMAVEWCSQTQVLSHRSIGCFVTHCGWNSTIESLFYGVPMIAFPQWTDQPMNAKLIESIWGAGVRAKATDDKVLEEKELLRCLNLVMGESNEGLEIRRRAETWKNRAQEAVSEEGSSTKNLKAFIGGIGLS